MRSRAIVARVQVHADRIDLDVDIVRLPQALMKDDHSVASASRAVFDRNAEEVIALTIPA
jgi:hypothetical protein